MTFLPIVGRELRVAARKRSTFWVRVSAAIVALVIGCGFLIVAQFRSGFGTASFGKGLFLTLTWLCFFAVLSAGLFFTSDCLSEEKRDGTIGLLFLTDLRGYDVVLGKLLATSLRAFYALLAVFPVLGITLLMGGVTGIEFWKTSLALVSALILSLAIGVFISAVSRDSQKALAGTLLVIVLLALAGPLMDRLFGGGGAVRQRFFALSSPAYLFASVTAWTKDPWWTALLINQLIAWGLMGVACLVLPRTWQERKTARGNRRYQWKFGTDKHRTKLREKLLGLNPVLWLASQERWQGVVLWVLSLLLAGVVAVMLAVKEIIGSGWIAWSYFGGAVTLVLYLAITSQACRCFVDVRRSGFLEMLLATPLTARQIVQGQWRALLRMFGVPLAIYLMVQFVAAVMVQESWRQIAAAVPAPPPAATTPPAGTTNTTTAVTTSVVTVKVTGPGGARAPVTAATGSSSGPPRWVSLAICVGSTLVTAANLLALAWFGMWMGLTSKNASVATLKTLVFVQIIPWFVISFVSAMAVPLLLIPSVMKTGGPPQIFTWYPLITSAVSTVLCLSKDAGFFLWARGKLSRQFRERASQETGISFTPVMRPETPPPLPVATR